MTTVNVTNGTLSAEEQQAYVKWATERYGVELPICQTIYNVLYEGADRDEALGALFHRSLKQEF